MAQTKATILGMGFARNLFLNTESVGPVWFVPFLFCIYALFLLIEKICKNKFVEFFVVVSLSLLGFFIGIRVFLPWSFDASLTALPLFYVGKQLKQHQFFKWKYCGFFALACGAFWLLLYRKSGMVALVTRAYESYPFCLFTALAGSIFIIYILQFIEQNKKSTALLKPFAFCGRHSMLLLGIHTIELWHVGWLDTIQSKCPNLLCSFIVYLALLIGIAMVILSIKYILSHIRKSL